jgi:hypothetical protein
MTKSLPVITVDDDRVISQHEAVKIAHACFP